MTNEELQQIRTIVQEVVAPLSADVAGLKGDIAEIKVVQSAMDAKLDHVIARADDMAEQVKMRTEIENRDLGISDELDRLRAPVSR